MERVDRRSQCSQRGQDGQIHVPRPPVCPPVCPSVRVCWQLGYWMSYDSPESVGGVVLVWLDVM